MMGRTKQLQVLALTLGVLALIWVIFVAVTAQDAPECTIWVQPGESIQAALDQTPEGAVICLSEGTWEKNIKVTKSLTLRGAGERR